MILSGGGLIRALARCLSWKEFIMIILIVLAVTIIIVVGLLLASIPLMKSGWKDVKKGMAEKREFEKYDFEHRSSGGVVTFPSFEDAEQDKVNRARTQIRISSGSLRIAIAIALIILAPFTVVAAVLVLLFYRLISY
jgi:lysylphosphatidylglycerol synthetase-like protein (DUF2156 family)